MDVRELKLNRINGIINLATAIGLLAMFTFFIYGCQIGIFTSQKALVTFLKNFGLLAPIIFTFLQAVQVIIPILPGGVGCLAGVLIFGPVMGFVYNYVGICIGSVIAFIISKRYGLGFIKNRVSKKTFDKYIGWLDKGDKFDEMFAVAIFLPVAPDDFLCYLAGITKMTLKKFTLIILLCKPCSIFLYSMGLNSIMDVAKKFL